MIKIGIVGGTGYTGVELLRLLAPHPRGRRARDHLAQGSRHARRATCSRACAAATTSRSAIPPTPASTRCDVVFFATPHGVAMAQARELVGAGVQDHRPRRRLPPQGSGDVRAWYKMPHACPDLLAESVYGLPEINRDAIRKARIVGNPGCYPTAVQLGFLPLRRSRHRRHRAPDRRLQIRRVGRRAQGRDAACCSPRRPTTSRPTASAGHRHHPEIVQGLEPRAAKTPVTLVVHAAPGADDPRHPCDALCARSPSTDVDLQALFEKRYAGEPFVDVMPRGQPCRTRARCARRTCCRIAVHRPPGGDIALVLVGDGQPGQGRRRPGDAEHEPDVRPAETDRPHRAAGAALGAHGAPRASLGAGCARRSASARRGWRCARSCRWQWRAACWRAASRRSSACGGGASTSARSSAASTATKSTRGVQRSRPRARAARRERAAAHENAELESELAMTRGAQALAQQARLAPRTRTD